MNTLARTLISSSDIQNIFSKLERSSNAGFTGATGGEKVPLD